MTQVITEDQTKDMIDEYVKGGKFAEFVDKSCASYRTTVLQECQKVIVYEYYKSITKGGCNER